MHVENLGHESLVRVDAGGVAFMLRIPGMSDIHKGDTLRLRFDDVHLFDRQGAALRSA